MKKLFFLFFRLLFISIVWFVIFEFGARLFFGPPEQLPQNMTDDPILNHKWKPNTTITDRSHDIPFVLKINGQSFVEDHDISVKKPKNTIRIFYVGDSNVQGVVNKDKKMATLVGQMLNEKLTSNGKHIEVINAGTSSYAPSLYYLLIKNQLLKFSPDLIVVNVDMTDIRDDALYKTLSKFDKNGLPTAVAPTKKDTRNNFMLTPEGVKQIPFIDRLHNFVYYHVAFYYHLENYLTSVKKNNKVRAALHYPPVKPQVPPVGFWLTKTWSKETDNDIAYSLSLLKAIKNLGDKKHVTLVITSVPHYPQFSDVWSKKPHDVLENFAKKEKVPFLNGYKTLEKKVKGTSQDTYYWNADPTHFNEAGNKIWADAQVAFLVRYKNEFFPVLKK